MRARTLLRRSAFHYWRTNLAVVLGVAVGATALTGALLVGDSMRASLREVAVGRLGRVDYTLLSTRFFRMPLADELPSSSAAGSADIEASPVILLSGSVEHARSGARVSKVGVLGIDDRFWTLRSAEFATPPPGLDLLSAALNEPLARELGAAVGDDVLIRVGKPSEISAETLLGRRADTTAALRIRVQSVLPAVDLGVFSLNPRQYLPHNVFVPIAALQRAIDRAGRANAILATDKGLAREVADPVAELNERVRQAATAADLGLRVRADAARGYVSVESEAMLLEDGVIEAVRKLASAEGAATSTILTYLANDIAIAPVAKVAPHGGDESSPESGIPYSTVTALDTTERAYQTLRTVNGEAIPGLEPGEILLNQWSADDLGAAPGDVIALTYYVTGQFGELITETHEFTLRGIVAMDEAAADPGFTPEYRGVTDARNLADWDPPFPMDLNRVRDKDEQYWDEHRATPKALITLADGERLWTRTERALGRATSIRLYPGTDDSAKSLQGVVAGRLPRAALDRVGGLSFEPTRKQLLAAGEGTTDFGMLFIGFSFFLIASSAILVALLFRLAVERRSAEVGLQGAVGFTPARMTTMLVGEGAVLALVGCAVGLAGSIGYAWLMVIGLKTWWSDAANMPNLRLHVSALSIPIGFLAALGVALLSIAWSVRGLTRWSVRALLAGAVAAGRSRSGYGRPRWARPVALGGIALALIAAGLPRLSEAVSAPPAFFCSGAFMLIGCMGLIAMMLRREHVPALAPSDPAALARLGVRNARRCFGRSVLTAGLIASAVFLIVALQAFRLEAGHPSHRRDTGTGGFSLYAEAAAPLLFDLNTRRGREALNLTTENDGIFQGASFMPFRLRPGDESSCLNLYKPTEPRVIGATGAMLRRGGFRFSRALAETDAESNNPWLILDRDFDGGVIPVIADEAAVLWQWHSGLGKEIIITDERGEPQRLRFVALLSQSMLQDEIIVSERAFTRLFPSIDGYGFFLIEAPADRTAELEPALESGLSPFGLDAASTVDRLNAYLAVQNTYLYTFQMLGGFGLVLGTIGLAAVMLRNVWERRGELALLRALGFSRRAIGWLVLIENMALLAAGLLAGLVSALVAIAPHLAARASTIPWGTIGLILFGVLLTGVLAAVFAIAPAVRAPLVPALRSE